MNAREQRKLQQKVEEEQVVMAANLHQLDMLLGQIAVVRREMQDTVQRLQGMGVLTASDEDE